MTAVPVSWWWIICIFLHTVRWITHRFSTKQSPVLNVPRSSVQSVYSNGVSLVSFLLCTHYLLVKATIWILWKLHCIAVPSPSLLLTNEVGSTSWSNNIGDTSNQSRPFGGYNRTPFGKNVTKNFNSNLEYPSNERQYVCTASVVVRRNHNLILTYTQIRYKQQITILKDWQNAV